MQGNGWNDLLINLNLPTFEVTKLKKWSFTLKGLVIDLSDTKNSPSTDNVFPESYRATIAISQRLEPRKPIKRIIKSKTIPTKNCQTP